MKKLLSFLIVLFLAISVFAYGKKDNISTVNKEQIVLASTSWTAAFADLAGVDNVKSIAPTSLRHPPEYEVTVSDIEKISSSNIFIYAGFERMMKTLGDAVGNTIMLKIKCDNSIETVEESAGVISAVTGTQEESVIRVTKYIKAIEKGKTLVEKRGLKNKKILCNKNQIYLAKDLGLNVSATFGPGPVTSAQIADAKTGNYDLIIDNVHNPVGMPLVEVSPNSKYIIWRNFPEVIERDALLHVIEKNIDSIIR